MAGDSRDDGFRQPTVDLTAAQLGSAPEKGREPPLAGGVGPQPGNRRKINRKEARRVLNRRRVEARMSSVGGPMSWFSSRKSRR